MDNVHREVVAKSLVQTFYTVYNSLGYGFLEKIYENALALELNEQGLKVQQQAPLAVYYRGHVMGNYFADLLVEDCIITEIKATESLAIEHEAQLLNYLKATEIDIGFLLNFGPRPQVKRKIFEINRRR